MSGPELIKGGFIFGTEGGDGELLVRHNDDGWSTPKFYGMGSASFGLQAGLEQAELVFIINSRRALSGIEHGETKLGAGAGLTVVNLSSGAEELPPSMAAISLYGLRALVVMPASP